MAALLVFVTKYTSRQRTRDFLVKLDLDYVFRALFWAARRKKRENEERLFFQINSDHVRGVKSFKRVTYPHRRCHNFFARLIFGAMGRGGGYRRDPLNEIFFYLFINFFYERPVQFLIFDLCCTIFRPVLCNFSTCVESCCKCILCVL